MESKELATAAVAVVVVTIILTLGLVVMDEVKSQTYTFRTSSATDEVTALVDTEVDLTGEHGVSITSVTNSSNTLDSSNYTVTNNNFVLLESVYNNTKLNVSHGYNPETVAVNATKEGLSAGDTAAGFIPVIVVVIVAAIIIGIIFRTFKGQGGM